MAERVLIWPEDYPVDPYTPVTPATVAADDKAEATAAAVVPQEVTDARRSAGAMVDPNRRVKQAARVVWGAIPPRQRVNAVSGSRLPVPGWMTDRRIVVAAWVVAMILIAVDEHRYGYMLPRPARLWAATSLYGILAAAGSVDELVPVVNALAIGYAFTLGFQFYNGEGIFAATTKNQTAPVAAKAAAPATTPPATGTGG